MYVIIVALLGLVVSAWGLLLEKKVQADSNFKAACDFSENSSCTKTLKSKYSRVLFGIPNAYFGIAFFSLIAILAYLGGYQEIIFYVSAVATLVSGLLFGIICFKQRNFCLLCCLLVVICAVLTWLTCPFI